jgi:hypothetical protein
VFGGGPAATHNHLQIPDVPWYADCLFWHGLPCQVTKVVWLHCAVLFACRSFHRPDPCWQCTMVGATDGQPMTTMVLAHSYNSLWLSSWGAAQGCDGIPEVSLTAGIRGFEGMCGNRRRCSQQFCCWGAGGLLEATNDQHTTPWAQHLSSPLWPFSGRDGVSSACISLVSTAESLACTPAAT